jgi:30S ribosomal protein 3
MDKFLLYFCVAKRSIKIALAQKTGKGILPLTKFYSWPITDAWEDMNLFLETQKWISSVDSVSLLNTFTQVINYWDEVDTKITKDVTNVKEKFSGSLYTNLVFFGYKKGA